MADNVNEENEMLEAYKTLLLSENINFSDREKIKKYENFNTNIEQNAEKNTYYIKKKFFEEYRKIYKTKESDEKYKTYTNLFVNLEKKNLDNYKKNLREKQLYFINQLDNSVKEALKKGREIKNKCTKCKILSYEINEKKETKEKIIAQLKNDIKEIITIIANKKLSDVEQEKITKINSILLTMEKEYLNNEYITTVLIALIVTITFLIINDIGTTEYVEDIKLLVRKTLDNISSNMKNLYIAFNKYYKSVSDDDRKKFLDAKNLIRDGVGIDIYEIINDYLIKDLIVLIHNIYYNKQNIDGSVKSIPDVVLMDKVEELRFETVGNVIIELLLQNNIQIGENDKINLKVENEYIEDLILNKDLVRDEYFNKKYNKILSSSENFIENFFIKLNDTEKNYIKNLYSYVSIQTFYYFYAQDIKTINIDGTPYENEIYDKFNEYSFQINLLFVLIPFTEKSDELRNITSLNEIFDKKFNSHRKNYEIITNNYTFNIYEHFQKIQRFKLINDYILTHIIDYKTHNNLLFEKVIKGLELCIIKISNDANLNDENKEKECTSCLIKIKYFLLYNCIEIIFFYIIFCYLVQKKYVDDRNNLAFDTLGNIKYFINKITSYLYYVYLYINGTLDIKKNGWFNTIIKSFRVHDNYIHIILKAKNNNIEDNILTKLLEILETINSVNKKDNIITFNFFIKILQNLNVQQTLKTKINVTFTNINNVIMKTYEKNIGLDIEFNSKCNTDDEFKEQIITETETNVFFSSFFKLFKEFFLLLIKSKHLEEYEKYIKDFFFKYKCKNIDSKPKMTDGEKQTIKKITDKKIEKKISDIILEFDKSKDNEDAKNQKIQELNTLFATNELSINSIKGNLNIKKKKILKEYTKKYEHDKDLYLSIQNIESELDLNVHITLKNYRETNKNYLLQNLENSIKDKKYIKNINKADMLNELLEILELNTDLTLQTETNTILNTLNNYLFYCEHFNEFIDIIYTNKTENIFNNTEKNYTYKDIICTNIIYYLKTLENSLCRLYVNWVNVFPAKIFKTDTNNIFDFKRTFLFKNTLKTYFDYDENNILLFIKTNYTSNLNITKIHAISNVFYDLSCYKTIGNIDPSKEIHTNNYDIVSSEINFFYNIELNQKTNEEIFSNFENHENLNSFIKIKLFDSKIQLTNSNFLTIPNSYASIHYDDLINSFVLKLNNHEKIILSFKTDYIRNDIKTRDIENYKKNDEKIMYDLIFEIDKRINLNFKKPYTNYNFHYNISCVKNLLNLNNDSIINNEFKNYSSFDESSRMIIFDTNDLKPNYPFIYKCLVNGKFNELKYGNRETNHFVCFFMFLYPISQIQIEKNFAVKIFLSDLERFIKNGTFSICFYNEALNIKLRENIVSENVFLNNVKASTRMYEMFKNSYYFLTSLTYEKYMELYKSYVNLDIKIKKKEKYLKGGKLIKKTIDKVSYTKDSIDFNKDINDIEYSTYIKDYEIKDFFNLLEKDLLYAADILQQIMITKDYLYNSFTIVTGDTGTGKSTQFPLILLYLAFRFDKKNTIIDTQPRKNAVENNAKAISKFSGFFIPTIFSNFFIQYQTGDDNIHVSDTIDDQLKIKIVTDKLLLNEIIKNDFLVFGKDSSYDTIIIDEVHEHNQNMDLIISMMKKIMNFNDIHLYLVSATLGNDEEKYMDYFKDIFNDLKNPDLEECVYYGFHPSFLYRRLHISNLDQKRHKIDEYEIDSEMSKKLQLRNTDNIDINDEDFELINNENILKILNYKAENDENDYKQFLIFKAGEKEIRGCINYLIDNKVNKKYFFIPVFANNKKIVTDLISDITKNPGKIKTIHVNRKEILGNNENIKFEEGKENYKNTVYVSTNISEASITIKDLICVIDDGIEKINTYNYDTITSDITKKYISKLSMVQRKGRTGRGNDGEVFYLYTKDKILENPNYKLLQENNRENLIDLLCKKNTNTNKIFTKSNSYVNLLTTFCDSIINNSGDLIKSKLKDLVYNYNKFMYESLIGNVKMTETYNENINDVDIQLVNDTIFYSRLKKSTKKTFFSNLTTFLNEIINPNNKEYNILTISDASFKINNEYTYDKEPKKKYLEKSKFINHFHNLFADETKIKTSFEHILNYIDIYFYYVNSMIYFKNIIDYFANDKNKIIYSLEGYKLSEIKSEDFLIINPFKNKEVENYIEDYYVNNIVAFSKKKDFVKNETYDFFDKIKPEVVNFFNYVTLNENIENLSILLIYNYFYKFEYITIFFTVLYLYFIAKFIKSYFSHVNKYLNFSYLGIKDDFDYINIILKHKEFHDPELFKSIGTENYFDNVKKNLIDKIVLNNNFQGYLDLFTKDIVMVNDKSYIYLITNLNYNKIIIKYKDIVIPLFGDKKKLVINDNLTIINKLQNNDELALYVYFDYRITKKGKKQISLFFKTYKEYLNMKYIVKKIRDYRKNTKDKKILLTDKDYVLYDILEYLNNIINNKDEKLKYKIFEFIDELDI